MKIAEPTLIKYLQHNISIAEGYMLRLYLCGMGGRGGRSFLGDENIPSARFSSCFFSCNTFFKLDFWACEALCGLFESTTQFSAGNSQTTERAAEHSAMGSQMFNSSSMWFSHIIQYMNDAIACGEFDPSVRAFYKIDASDDTVPVINNDYDLKTWGKNLVDGEAARAAAGGALMTFPTVLDFDNNHFKLWKTSLTAHSTLKDAFDNAQETIAGKRAGYDSLITRVWDEIETFFGELESTGKRRHAREWGVVYAPSPGEKVTIVIPPNSTVAAQNFTMKDDTDYHGKNVSAAAIILCRGALAGTPCATGVTLNGASEIDFDAAGLGASGGFLNATNHDPAIEVTVVVTVL